MESPKTSKDAPVTTFTPETTSEEVQRLDEGVEPLMGPVVVGGLAGSDCFQYRGQLQAGREREKIDWSVPTDYDPNTPRKSPW